MSSNTVNQRVNFASTKNPLEYPDFLEVQLKSFQDFLQLDTMKILDIKELQKMAEKQVGIPKPLEYTDRTVALVEYRDGTVIDAIKEVKD